jgi:hypothetical protein
MYRKQDLSAYTIQQAWYEAAKRSFAELILSPISSDISLSLWPLLIEERYSLAPLFQEASHRRFDRCALKSATFLVPKRRLDFALTAVH